MQSPSGKPVCITEPSSMILQERGFVVVADHKPMDADKPMTSDIGNTTHPIPQSIAQANNEFAIDFYREISNNTKNQFFSPLSMYTAFSMLYEGARENTAAELQDVFHFEPDKNIRVNQTSQMISSINRDDPDAVLELANAMWVESGFGLNPAYVDTIRHTYAAHIEQLPLATSTDIINQWASEKTREKIPKVLTPADIPPDVAMVLTNAVYFKGTWVTQFDPENTRNDTFWRDSQNINQTEFMNLSLANFNYTSADGIQILKMPYEGDRLSMLVLLPNSKDGIKDLEEKLSAEKLQEWQENLKPVEIDVKFPKFTMNTDYDLMSELQSMGVKDVFKIDIADLSGISDAPDLFVSKASQKAFVDVNEEGTEAAAVTTTVLHAEEFIPTPSFIADHPFLFIIQDNESRTILFMGKMSDPPK